MIILQKRSFKYSGSKRPSFLFASVSLGLVLLFYIGCGKGPQAPGAEYEKTFSQGPCRVRVRVSKRSITIAEKITLILEATATKDTGVEMPQFGEKLEQFGISHYVAPPPELLPEGRVLTRRTYTLEPFLSGEYKIPPMAVRFREKGQGPDAREVLTEEITVRVKSLLPSQVRKLEIRDIDAPQEIPFPLGWKTLAQIGAGILLLGALGAYLFLRRRRNLGEAARRALAHETAYAALEGLLAEGLIERGEIKEFYNRISGILRHYIEDRFGLRAPERTTEEFLNEMEGNPLLEPGWKILLSRFLAHCDLVKFAEHQPSTSEIQSTLDTCKDFIEATRERGEGEKPRELQRNRDTGTTA